MQLLGRVIELETVDGSLTWYLVASDVRLTGTADVQLVVFLAVERRQHRREQLTTLRLIA